MLKSWIYCFFALILLGCTPTENIKPDTAVKNVILIIGDGMGPQQVGLLLSYARQAPHGVIRDRQTALDRMMEQGRLGIAMTYSAGTLVTDSAASATQLATGLPVGSEMLGLDQDGNRQENLIEKARRLGKATGLVSDTRITHATPAAFAAHQTHRSQENDIAEDLLAAQPDVMLSGGLSYWIPRQTKRPFPYLTGGLPVKSKRTDNKDLLQTARRQGYTLAFNKAQLQQARGKTLGLFAGSGMPDGIVETRLRSDAGREVPTLREMAVKALDLLEDHERGFFLMIEAGQIDWASHRNDTGLLLHEMLRFNDMLNAVLDWAANRQDTLIIVTADHETGGFGFSYSAENLPPPRKLPGAAFANSLFAPGFNFGSPEVLDKLYAQQLSYHDIFQRFDALPLLRRTPTNLADLVNRHTAFKISEDQARAVLATEDNPFFHVGHHALGARRVPKMGDNGAFFVYQRENRENLLARAVATSQQVVWATGTHTSTPVYVFAQGPEASIKPFARILHHTQTGQLISRALQ